MHLHWGEAKFTTPSLEAQSLHSMKVPQDEGHRTMAMERGPQNKGHKTGPQTHTMHYKSQWLMLKMLRLSHLLLLSIKDLELSGFIL